MNRRGFLAAVTGVAVLPLLAGCPGAAGEAEDCDADDRREGDEDCDEGGARKPKKPKTKTKTRTKTRTTRSGRR